MDKLKVVEFTEAWTPGGVESYIVNIADSINVNRFEIIIWATQVYASLFDDDLKRLGKELYSPVNVESFPNPIKRTLNGIRIFKDTVKELECDVFHLHASNGIAWIYAYMAKKCGVKKIVFHAHSSYLGQKNRVIKLIVHNICKSLFKNSVDVRLACSDKAASFMYPKRDLTRGAITFVNCIIDIDRFRFNQEIRETWRKKYGIDDQEAVLIHVGRFQYEKNHAYLMDIFREISRNIPSRLILIGEGKELSKVEEKIVENKLDGNVIIIDKTREVQNYLFMSDAFILPSLHEGNPIVTAEAQAAGLTCYISERVTKRAKLLDSTKYIGIEDASEAARVIVDDYRNKVWEFDRTRCNDIVKCQGYDKNQQIKALEDIYEEK